MADVERAKAFLLANDEKPVQSLTVADYARQNAGSSDVYYDTRAMRIVESPAVDLNPDDTEVAAFLHHLTAPDAAMEAARIAAIEALNGPHVFLDKFSCMLGPTMAHFKQGQVVKDFALLQALKNENAPMVPATMAPGMTCCPQCRHVFRAPSVMPVKRAG